MKQPTHLDPGQVWMILKQLTEIHRQWNEKDPGQAEALILQAQVPLVFLPPEKGDLLVGRVSFPPFGFTPQVYNDRGGFGYYLDIELLNQWLPSEHLDGNEQQELVAILKYWSQLDAVANTRKLYDPDLEENLSGDNWTGEPGMAFPLYRMAGAQLDFSKLVNSGLPGLKQEINDHLSTAAAEPQRTFYHACLQALEAFTCLLDYYLEASFQPVGAREAQRIQAALKSLKTNPPRTFFEAIQLSFLYVLFSGAQNYGRMDDYLGPFLQRDLQSGMLDVEQAVQLLESLWRLMDARGTIYDGRVTIGGKGRKNETAADLFAELAIRVTGNLKTVLPQLTLRLYNGQKPALWQQALDELGRGNVYPMLYNDEVNIPAVQSAFGVDLEEAAQYLPFGCGEYVLYHRSFSTPSGVINLPKILEVVLHRGFDPSSGKQLIPEAIHWPSFDDFESLKNIYLSQVARVVEVLARQQKIEYEYAAETAPFLLYSILHDDCLKCGKPIFAGGIRYLGGTLESYGNITVADSLVAIKKLVFEKQAFSLDHLISILDLDFKGYDKERQQLIKAPKFGNDSDDSDELYLELHQHLCRSAMEAGSKAGLDYYLIVVINNDANTDLGLHTGASADGRYAGKHLSNGNAPYDGRDQSGITALLNSMAKPEAGIHAGMVQNLKLSPAMFGRYRRQTEKLLETYFRKGGTQLMITVINRLDLEQALQEPESYAHLVVRVGGFSARFIDLRPEVQQEIIARTCYEPI